MLNILIVHFDPWPSTFDLTRAIDNLKSEMISDAMKPYETTNIYIASPPSERELMLEVRKHLESGGFRVRTMHESEIAFRAAYPDCDYLREMFEGKF